MADTITFISQIIYSELVVQNYKFNTNHQHFARKRHGQLLGKFVV